MKKRDPVAARFLEVFTKTIIENQAKKHLIPIELKSLALRRNLIQTQRETTTLENKMEQPAQQARQTYKKPLARPLPAPKHEIIKKTATMTKKVEVMPIQSQLQQKPQQPGLALINPLLSDPAVQGIECTGPSKPLLINKSGLIQTTNISLSTDEISTFMHEVSERTRIPLVQGLFKAVMGNLIITAVISDIIGARFVIQKRGLPLPPPRF